MPIDSTIQLDSQGNPIYSPLPFLASKRITFAGGTLNAIGDHDGTGDPFTIFTVTGDVEVRLVAICKTDLVGAATLEVGVAGNTACLLAQIADATALDQNETWIDATPAKGEGLAPVHNIIGGGLDIIGTVGVADITAGVVDFYCYWRPLSADGKVVAA